jgi:hypothetical protein
MARGRARHQDRDLLPCVESARSRARLDWPPEGPPRASTIGLPGGLRVSHHLKGEKDAKAAPTKKAVPAAKDTKKK